MTLQGGVLRIMVRIMFRKRAWQR